MIIINWLGVFAFIADMLIAWGYCRKRNTGGTVFYCTLAIIMVLVLTRG